MKSVTSYSMILLLLALTSCETIGDVFSAGVYTGILIVVVVLIIIVVILAKLGKRG